MNDIDDFSIEALERLETKTNANGDVYYIDKDDNGKTIYSFTPDFEDYWTQEDEDFHNNI
jgi:hypothetical protein